MPDAPTPLDLDAIREMLADRRTLGRSAALDLIHEVEVQRILIDALREGVRILQTARPAPAWDEEAVTESAARAIYDAFRAAEAEDAPDVGYSSWDETSSHMRYVARSQAAAAVAVVRDHLPVKPSREAVIDALWGTSKNLPIPHIDREEMVTAQADAALALLPGRSEAEVKAEQHETYRRRIDALNARLAALGFPRCACHPAEDDSERCLPDPAHWLAQVEAATLRAAADAVTEIDGRRDDTAAAWLRARAARLVAEGGADRG